MNTEAPVTEIEKIKLGDCNVFLEDHGSGKGNVVLSTSYGYNHSYFWGSMGGSLKEFLCDINSGYFANAMMGHHSNYTIDVPKTFKAVRQFIKTELEMPFYREMEFQKEMRWTLKQFQNSCMEVDNSNHFVDCFFTHFVDRLNFYLISNKHERDDIERSFKRISEHWYFIQEKPNANYLWLEKIHGQLVKHLKQINPSKP